MVLMANTMRVCAEINLDAICHNISEVQRKVGSNAKVMAVIKANGYGHGAVPVAQALNRRCGIYGFAVATAAEGAALRRSGVTQPILILGYSFPEQYEDVIRYHLTQTVFELESAAALSVLAVKMDSRVKVHIKVDTGMGRIGFLPSQDSVAVIRGICALPGLEAEGIFTHFACADETDKTAAALQKKRFSSFLRALEEADVSIPIQHVCNSASIIEFDDCCYHLVRSGIMTYGLYPSQEVDQKAIHLIPALSLKSHVSFVKCVHAGDTISYGATYTAAGDRVIATIPVGYGDGYPRQLSNKGRVLIGGESAPIVGRVCMDQFMVDVTGIPAVRQGDPVVLVGSMGQEYISVEEVAELAGSFHYEFVCNINRRVPRVYLEHGAVTKITDYLEDE